VRTQEPRFRDTAGLPISCPRIPRAGNNRTAASPDNHPHYRASKPRVSRKNCLRPKTFPRFPTRQKKRHCSLPHDPRPRTPKRVGKRHHPSELTCRQAVRILGSSAAVRAANNPEPAPAQTVLRAIKSLKAEIYLLLTRRPMVRGRGGNLGGKPKTRFAHVSGFLTSSLGGAAAGPEYPMLVLNGEWVAGPSTIFGGHEPDRFPS